MDLRDLQRYCQLIQRKYPYLHLNCHTSNYHVLQRQYEIFQPEVQPENDYEVYHPEYTGIYLDISRWKIPVVSIDQMRIVTGGDYWDNQIYRDQSRFVKVLDKFPSNDPNFQQNQYKYYQMIRDLVISKYLHERFPENIIEVEGYFEDRRMIGLISRPIDGVKLLDWIHQVNAKRYRQFLLDLAKLLQRIPQFTHYDLTPLNVMVGAQGQPILLDFGVSYLQIDLPGMPPALGENNPEGFIWQAAFPLVDVVKLVSLTERQLDNHRLRRLQLRHIIRVILADIVGQRDSSQKYLEEDGSLKPLQSIQEYYDILEEYQMDTPDLRADIQELFTPHDLLQLRLKRLEPHRKLHVDLLRSLGIENVSEIDYPRLVRDYSLQDVIDFLEKC